MKKTAYEPCAGDKVRIKWTKKCGKVVEAFPVFWKDPDTGDVDLNRIEFYQVVLDIPSNKDGTRFDIRSTKLKQIKKLPRNYRAKAENKKPDPIYTEFRVDTSESVEYTREPDPDDSWDVGDQHTTVDFQRAVICQSNRSGGLRETRVARNIDWDDDRVFIPWDTQAPLVTLVVSRYTTGCTFGHHTGLWCVEAAFPEFKDAEEFAKEHEDRLKQKHNDYFGGLDDVELVTVPLVRA